MPRKFVKYSRKHQQLIYAAIIKNYAAWMQSKDPIITELIEMKNDKKETSKINAYYSDKAKKELKQLYIQATRELSEKEPLEAFKSNLIDTLELIVPKTISIESKVEIIWSDIDYNLRKFIEELSIQLGSQETFSLALRLLSKEKAIAFTQYCIDYFTENEIPMDSKMVDMVKDAEHDCFIFAMLRQRKCAICGIGFIEFHIRTRHNKYPSASNLVK